MCINTTASNTCNLTFVCLCVCDIQLEGHGKPLEREHSAFSDLGELDVMTGWSALVAAMTLATGTNISFLDVPAKKWATILYRRLHAVGYSELRSLLCRKTILLSKVVVMEVE